MKKIALLTAATAISLTAMAHAGFVNELHYDNASADTGEFVEIVLAPGENIANFSLVLYNGSGGASYSTISSFTAGATQNGFQVFFAAAVGIQNGAPDGLALVSGGSVVSSGGVVQFLSYEGTFTATNGPASGLLSTDIGVSENGSGPVGASLGLIGNGDTYNDFTWTTFADDSPGAVNAGQTFEAAAIPEPLAAGAGGLLGLVALRRRRA